MHRPLIAVAATVALAPAAYAIDVTETVDTAAPPAKVWAMIADFGSIARWHPAAKTSPADQGNTVGSVRVITLRAPGDPTITEKLTAYDPAQRSYSYSIVKVDPSVLPVTSYISTIAVAPHGDGSEVTWKGHFDATPGATDSAARTAIAGVYRGGLDNIRTLAAK